MSPAGDEKLANSGADLPVPWKIHGPLGDTNASRAGSFPEPRGCPVSLSGGVLCGNQI